MSDLTASPIDPRVVTRELDRPTYLVTFFEGGGGGSSWATDELLITGASSVHEVLAWCDTTAKGRPFTLDLLFSEAGDVTALHLSGTDLNDPRPERG